VIKNVVVLGARRTAMGAFQGEFSSLAASDLGAQAIRSALSDSAVAADQVSEVYMGNVLSAGQGQAPARQASLKAGLANSIPCTTISKVCGSGMQALMQASNAIQCDPKILMVAGGMESMTNAPYLLAKVRSGYRLGHQSVKDSMFVDGLEDAGSGKAMGIFAQQVADRFDVSRKQMDDYALRSLNLATEATENGFFEAEITPVSVAHRKGDIVVSSDEQIKTAKPEKIPSLRPAFADDGTITAANSSSISDGAAALVLASSEKAEELNVEPLAFIRGHATFARSPENFTLAPSSAINSVLRKVGWSIDDVDLYEINEAFAVVTMLAAQELKIDLDKVNVHGGACAIGHPLGASGARIVVTLIHALKRLGKSKGVASLCIGGGEATAIAVEIPN